MSVSCKKGLLLLSISFVLFSCLTTRKIIEYPDYEYSIDLDFSQKDPSRPFIEIAINNDAYLTFFDTGATGADLMIYKEDIEKIGLEATGEEYRFASATEVYTVPEYLMPEYTIDNKIIARNRTIIERPLTFGGEYSINMSFSAFSDYNVLMSYKHQKLFLYKKTADLDFLHNWTKVDIIKLDKGNGPFFYGKVAGIERPLVFYIDTGASVYNPQRNIATDLILTREIRDIGVAKKGLTYEFSGRRFKIKQFAYLGNINENAPVDAFLSYYFLQQYDVFFDLDNKVFYIEK